MRECAPRAKTFAREGAANEEKFVGDSASWHAIVRRALYRGANEYSFDAMFHPELVSLCSLLTGYRRGSVREVITFNYDDLIQSYLRLHGHPCNVVSPVPFVLSPNFGTTFYHPHGYLPLLDTKHRGTPFIVASKRSYRRVQSGTTRQVDGWRQMIASLLSTRIGLFLGVSGTDNILELYFDQATELAGKSMQVRPLGFAILLGTGNRPTEDWLTDRIIPLEFGTPTDVARFLAQICQQAASLASESSN